MNLLTDDTSHDQYLQELEAYKNRSERLNKIRMSQEQESLLEQMASEEPVSLWTPKPIYPQPYSIRIPYFLNESQAGRYREYEHNRLKHQAREKQRYMKSKWTKRQF